MMQKKPYLCLAGLVFVVYANVYLNSFHFDDLTAILQKPWIRGLDKIPMFIFSFARRPLVILSLNINYYLSEFQVWSYHLSNVIFHVIAVCLVYRLVFELSNLAEGSDDLLNKRSGFLAAIIFALHPINTQAVTYISSRSSIMATCFYLISTIFILKCFAVRKKEIEAKSNNVKYHEFFHREENDIYCRLPISFSQAALGAEIEVPLFEKFFKSGTLFICAVISLFFGVLCKEIVVTFPAIAFLAHYFFVSGQSFFKWVRQNFKMICGAALCLILGLIWVLSHDKFLSSSPTSVSWQTYLLTQTFVIPFEYFWKIFFPFNLSIDIDFPLVSDWAKISSFFGVGILSFYLWICFKVQSRLISFGMLWGVIAFFPTSSFVPLLDIAVEHRVYLPLAGFSLAMAGMILAIEQALRKRFSNNDLLGNVGSKASLVCPLIIILCFGVLTTKRNEVWKDEVSLWKDAKEKAPRVVRPYNNLGEAYDKLGNYSPAIDEFKAALSLNPNYVFALSNLGNIYGKLKNYPESVEYFRKAIFIKPDYAPANYNLGKALHAMGKPLEAREYYKKAVDANQYFSEAIFNLAHIESELGFFKDSVKHFQDFIKLRPNLDKAYLALGRAYIGGGESRKAINEFQKALELNPSSLSANINLATAYLESGKVDKSIAIFYGILNRYPKIAGIHKNLGLIFYQHKKDRVKAIHHLKESLSLDNNQPQAAQIRSLILELTQNN